MSLLYLSRDKMTVINPNPAFVSREEMDARYWMNQIPLPPTPDNIYNIPCQDRMFRIKKAKDYPFGSVAGFTQEQDVIERFLYPNINKDSLFFDIGACWGQYSLRVLSMGARVVAFEPDPRMVIGLKTNINLNSGFSDRFILYEGAVSQINGNMDMDDLEDIPTANLDSFIDYYVPTFIKIDVEGDELYVIKGAINLLKRHKPKLLIENHIYMGSDRTHGIAQQYVERAQELVMILKSVGYKFEMGPGVGRTYFTFCS